MPHFRETILQPNERLKLLREKLGLSPNEMAVRLGVTSGAYYDWEDHDDDLPMTISLAELRNLSNLLGTTPLYIFTGESAAPDRRISFEHLADLVRKHLLQHGLTLEQFEDQAGWELKEFLSEPSAALKWNPDCLRHVSEALGISWVDALPE